MRASITMRFESVLSARGQLFIIGLICAIWAVGAPAASPLDGRWLCSSSDSALLRQRVRDRLAYVDRSNAQTINTPNGPSVVGIRTVHPNAKAVDDMVALIGKIVPLAAVTRIQGDKTHITVTYSDGRVRRLCVGCPGQSVQSTAATGVQPLVIAGWEKQALTVETNSSAGFEVLETFHVDSGNKRLHVGMVIHAPAFQKSIRLNRVCTPSQASRH